MGEPSTPLFKLADLLLADEGGFYVWAQARRAEGLSWRRIERDLFSATDGRVDATGQAISGWFRDCELAEAS